MRDLLLVICAMMCCVATYAQSVTGRVVDATTRKAIDYADVVVVDADNKTVASTAVREGKFTLDNVRDGSFYLTIMVVGYQPYTSDKLTFSRGAKIDLGEIALSMVETGLKEVVVEGERSKIVYKLDRQRISGSASLSASGGTAVDVLKSAPSVRIDADGNLSFRGSTGFLVYVDGKPSMLEGTQALNQIAAANIADIEIITTPSAKYKTDGDVGIVNIITKNDNKQGFSGSVNLSASTIGTWNSDLLFGYRKGANRWYVGYAGSQLKDESEFRQLKTTIVDDYITTSDADGSRYRSTDSQIGRVGWEFNKSNHALTVEVQGGMTRWLNGGDMLYDEHREQGGVVINDAIYDSHDHNYIEKHIGQASFDYVWKLNDRGDKISLDSRMRYDWYSLEYTESNLFELSGARWEGTRGYESEHHWDFDGSANYELNYREGGKMELGYQYTSYSEHGNYNIRYWNREVQDYEWQEDLYTPFYYRRQIHSAYVMFTDKFGPVTLDAGVRADNMHDVLTIDFEGADRDVKRLELFPSTHIAYDAGNGNTITAGYSYRTNRAGVWKLEPYITYKDYYTRLTGNPDLAPEYIHSAEVGYRKSFKNSNSLSVSGFYRHRRGVYDLIRVAYEPGVTLDSLINAGVDRTMGIEANLQTRNTRWWSMTMNGSLFHYKFMADFVGSTDSENTSYAASWINNFTLSPTTRMQFDANFVGPTVLTQGREEAYCYFDLAIRQQLLKNKMSLALVAHDLFRTARYDHIRDSQTLKATTFVKPRYPNITLSLSYHFNSSAGKEQKGAVTSGAAFVGKDF
ncbi:MAG: TonB-dependent receptor [Alistipes sp.]|nr:TonB-dependent receptor [Alistipes sp.]